MRQQIPVGLPAPGLLPSRPWRAFGRLGLAAMVLAVGLTAAASPARAAATPAGTVIDNTAEVTARFPAGPVSVRSNVARISVAQVFDVTATPLAALVAVKSGDTGRAIAFRLTNTGNGPESLRLLLTTAVAGNGFDAVPHTPALYLDTDGSQTLTAADAAYAPGGNDPLLAADASVLVFAVVDVPSGLAEASRGRLQLAARNLAGSGAPGTVFAGKGPAGVDAIAGLTGGQATATTELVVSGFDVVLTKTATVVDATGGARPEPGARISYDIAVQVTGTTTAHALVVSDPVPATTTYVAGSLTLDGAPLTDAVDADAGSVLAGPARIEVTLGDLAPGITRHVKFTVSIN